MRELLFLATFFLAGTAFSQGSDMSKAAFNKYLEDCKKMILQSQPNKDPKDVDMLCRDPYLKGTPNESKKDKARRERSIKETDEAKHQALDKVVDKKTTVKNNLPEGMSKAVYDKYLRDCKVMILKAHPGKDPKDIDMLCSDPDLKGRPNESIEDKARRERLIKETDIAKEKALDKFIDKKDPKQINGAPDEMSKPEYDSYIKNCKKLVLEADPGKDPKDAEMLCRDPNLKGKSNESYDDQVRRKRLIKETDDAKHKALEKYVAPTSSDKPSNGGIH
ncbi:MAG: hypothetical protein ACXVCY_16325 [Pseudobdellovibrionaceae bacterium]